MWSCFGIENAAPSPPLPRPAVMVRQAAFGVPFIRLFMDADHGQTSWSMLFENSSPTVRSRPIRHV